MCGISEMRVKVVVFTIFRKSAVTARIDVVDLIPTSTLQLKYVPS